MLPTETILMAIIHITAIGHIEVYGSCYLRRPCGCPWPVMSPEATLDVHDLPCYQGPCWCPWSRLCLCCGSCCLWDPDWCLWSMLPPEIMMTSLFCIATRDHVELELSMEKPEAMWMFMIGVATRHHNDVRHLWGSWNLHGCPWSMQLQETL